MTSSPDSRFSYASATKNSFVMVNDPEAALDLTPERVVELTSAAGTDGLIRAVRSAALGTTDGTAQAEWFMDYRNADGSLAQMCGNGVRAFAALLREHGYETRDFFTVMTRAGERTVEILEHGPHWQVRVGMGPVLMSDTGRHVHVAGRILPGIDANVGNPHVVVRLPSDIPLESLDLRERPRLEPEPEEGANVEFVRILDERHVAFRVYERGVGETLSCGTGATAVAAVAAHLAGDTTREAWRVDVRGGQLEIGWDERGELTLAGPAELGNVPAHPAFARPAF